MGTGHFTISAALSHFAAVALAVVIVGAGEPGPRAGNSLLVAEAAAQTSPDPRESGSETVRRRQAEQAIQQEGQRRTGRYWTPFDLAREGKCDEAVPELARLAERGRGYEYAQNTYGTCLMETGQIAEGQAWIEKAAQAGLADAQATHLINFLDRGIGYLPDETAAMWLHLYETNPLRLTIGTVIVLSDEQLADVRNRIPRPDYLAGVEAARRWTPTFSEATAASNASPPNRP